MSKFRMKREPKQPQRYTGRLTIDLHQTIKRYNSRNSTTHDYNNMSIINLYQVFSRGVLKEDIIFYNQESYRTIYDDCSKDYISCINFEKLDIYGVDDVYLADCEYLDASVVEKETHFNERMMEYRQKLSQYEDWRIKNAHNITKHKEELEAKRRAAALKKKNKLQADIKKLSDELHNIEKKMEV